MSTEVAAGVTLSDMAGFALREAQRIEDGQEAEVKAGLKSRVSPDKKRDAEICRGIFRLTELIRKNPKVMELLK